jgi:hypothetical protein
MPEKKSTENKSKEKTETIVKNRTITPASVRGLSTTTKSANVLPSNVKAAILSGNIQGTIPPGTMLPMDVVVTQGYHPGHYALDLAGPQGTKVYAPEDMTIVQAGKGAFGLDVIGTNPATGERFTFGHFEAIGNIQAGQTIKAGTLIGLEGSTFTPPGYSTGPHVHFQANLSSGAPVMPTAADILKTFVSNMGGNISLSNVSLMAASDAAVRSLKTTNQTSEAVNQSTVVSDTGTASSAQVSSPSTKKEAKATAQKAAQATPLAGSNAQTTQAQATNPSSSSGSALSTASFLAGHAPLDWAMMGAGLLLILFGVLFLLKTAGSQVAQSVPNPWKMQLDFMKKRGGARALAEQAGGA